uniref:Uncharacterized protein n=1 Tax=Oryza glumipatula TaxID=40148 RepID=A0A0D9YRG4_9ORYZ
MRQAHHVQRRHHSPHRGASERGGMRSERGLEQVHRCCGLNPSCYRHRFDAASSTASSSAASAAVPSDLTDLCQHCRFQCALQGTFVVIAGHGGAFIVARRTHSARSVIFCGWCYTSFCFNPVDIYTGDSRGRGTGFKYLEGQSKAPRERSGDDRRLPSSAGSGEPAPPSSKESSPPPSGNRFPPPPCRRPGITGAERHQRAGAAPAGRPPPLCLALLPLPSPAHRPRLTPRRRLAARPCPPPTAGPPPPRSSLQTRSPTSPSPAPPSPTPPHAVAVPPLPASSAHLSIASLRHCLLPIARGAAAAAAAKSPVSAS